MAKGGGEREQKRAQHKRSEDAPEAKEQSATAEKAEELKDEIDELLDEIDEVLEQNAEEFVRSFIQKGGQ